jgi:hypothetical protein
MYWAIACLMLISEAACMLAIIAQPRSYRKHYPANNAPCIGQANAEA